jgi:hypothetical protein
MRSLLVAAVHMVSPLPRHRLIIYALRDLRQEFLALVLGIGHVMEQMVAQMPVAQLVLLLLQWQEYAAVQMVSPLARHRVVISVLRDLRQDSQALVLGIGAAVEVMGALMPVVRPTRQLILLMAYVVPPMVSPLARHQVVIYALLDLRQDFQALGLGIGAAVEVTGALMPVAQLVLLLLQWQEYAAVHMVSPLPRHLAVVFALRDLRQDSQALVLGIGAAVEVMGALMPVARPVLLLLHVLLGLSRGHKMVLVVRPVFPPEIIPHLNPSLIRLHRLKDQQRPLVLHQLGVFQELVRRSVRPGLSCGCRVVMVVSQMLPKEILTHHFLFLTQQCQQQELERLHVHHLVGMLMELAHQWWMELAVQRTVREQQSHQPVVSVIASMVVSHLK